MMKKSALSTLGTGLMLLLLILTPGCNLLGGAQTVVKIEPATLTLGVGQTAEVLINIENVKNLFGLDIVINFDANLLEVVDANPNIPGAQIAAGGFLSPDMEPINAVTGGAIDYALVQIEPHGAVSGNGTLAKITFKGKAPGTTDIIITSAILYDDTNSGIPNTLQNGTVVVEGSAIPDASKPTAVPQPTATPVPPTPVPTAIPQPTLSPSEGVNCTRVLGHHIVKQGETLYAIGRVYATRPDAIAACNNLSNPGKIHAGNKLIIPYAPWSPIPPGPVAERQFLPNP